MQDIIQAILSENYTKANALIKEALELRRDQKFVQLKQIFGAYLSEVFELAEANIVRQGRIKLIRRRIRKGKLQRNIRKSAVKGFTLQRGRLKRIPAARRIHMRIVQRRAARKRRAHLQMSLRRRKISLRKRKAMGIKESHELRSNQQD